MILDRKYILNDLLISTAYLNSIWTMVLIAPVPDHCLPFTFVKVTETPENKYSTVLEYFFAFVLIVV